MGSGSDSLVRLRHGCRMPSDRVPSRVRRQCHERLGSVPLLRGRDNPREQYLVYRCRDREAAGPGPRVLPGAGPGDLQPRLRRRVVWMRRVVSPDIWSGGDQRRSGRFVPRCRGGKAGLRPRRGLVSCERCLRGRLVRLRRGLQQGVQRERGPVWRRRSLCGNSRQFAVV